MVGGPRKLTEKERDYLAKLRKKSAKAMRVAHKRVMKRGREALAGNGARTHDVSVMGIVEGNNGAGPEAFVVGTRKPTHLDAYARSVCDARHAGEEMHAELAEKFRVLPGDMLLPPGADRTVVESGAIAELGMQSAAFVEALMTEARTRLTMTERRTGVSMTAGDLAEAARALGGPFRAALEHVIALGDYSDQLSAEDIALAAAVGRERTKARLDAAIRGCAKSIESSKKTIEDLRARLRKAVGDDADALKAQIAGQKEECALVKKRLARETEARNKLVMRE